MANSTASVSFYWAPSSDGSSEFTTSWWKYDFWNVQMDSWAGDYDVSVDIWMRFFPAMKTNHDWCRLYVTVLYIQSDHSFLLFWATWLQDLYISIRLLLPLVWDKLSFVLNPKIWKWDRSRKTNKQKDFLIKHTHKYHKDFWQLIFMVHRYRAN